MIYKGVCLMVVLSLLSCNPQNEIYGKWYFDGIEITINKSKIIFSGNPNDFVYYKFNLKDSLVIFKTEAEPEINTWKGKIELFSNNEIIYYDSLFKKEYKLMRE